MAQSVVTKKVEKAEAILNAMEDIFSLDEFKDRFKTAYPDDWKRIISRYNAEERKDTKGKGHPMPEPEVYLKNMYKVALNKHKSS